MLEKINLQKDSLWWPPNKGILIKGEQKITKEALLKEKQKVLNFQEEQKLKKACQDFESFFLYYLLKQMRQATFGGGLLEQTRPMQLYQGMFDEAIADKIAKSKGIGLSQMLYEQIKQNLLK